MYISLLFDVEDIICPQADDAARAVAEIVSGEGARATFCVVGERARQWGERGRDDVIHALARHDIGFHTDGHSRHPTVLEYLAGTGWEDGIAEVLRRERPGVEALQRAFANGPSCWGGPGNTWGPQVNEAMRRLGVPAIVYAHTRVPEGDVHRYSDILCYPCGCSLRDGEYHHPLVFEADLGVLVTELERRRGAGTQWTEVFLGHPSRILHEEFWDGPSFSRGRALPRGEWIAPRRKSDAEYELALANLRRAVTRLVSLEGIRIRTIREMNDLFAGSRAEALSAREIAEIGAVIEANLASMGRWPILPPDLDLSGVRALSLARLGTLRRLRLA